MALPRPFTAFATQNPLKIEGTEPLPKVLADRFLMKIDVDYPSPEEEQQMLRLKESNTYSGINRVLSTDDILAMQREAAGVSLPDDVAAYITRVVAATRTEMHVVMGASPRADIAFMQCAKAKALIEGRKEVSREDIKFLARPVLSHRITVRSTGGIGVKGVIDGIIASVK
jgi:MoxR-like ATPase